MEKRFIILIILIAMFSYSTFAQLKVNSSGNIGIGCDPSSYKLYVNGTSRLQGNVGIGTAPSSYKLYVYGTSRLQGNVGIGTAPSSYALYVNGTSRFHNQEVYLTINSEYIKFDQTDAEGDLYFEEHYYEPIIRPELDDFGYLGKSTKYFAYVYSNYIYYDYLIQGSDVRLKENIREIESPLLKLQQVRGIKYDHAKKNISHYSIEKQNKINRKDNFGFIAQELMDIYPELVEYDDSTDLYGVNYIGMIPILVEAINEQQTMIENLNNEIFALKS